MRKIVIVLSACVVVLLLGYTSYRGYQVWKQSHGIAMAKGFIAQKDVRSALLALQPVLTANPRNVEGSRLMAALLEAEQMPSSLAWRERVVELDPQSLPDRLALAQAAVLQRNYPLATNTLAGVAETDRKTPAYHNLAGMAALMDNEPLEAESQFREAVRLDPADPLPQLNLAVVRLHRTNVQDVAEARATLQQIIVTSTNASLCSQARRELVIDAMNGKDVPTARRLSQELTQPTNAPFTDKLLRLDVLLKTQSAEFKPALALYQSEAAANPGTIFDLTRWQAANLSTADALRWLQRLPPSMQTNQTVEVLAAGCQLQLKDWPGLQAALQKENWSDPAHPGNDFEFMRHAYLARCLRGENFAEGSASEWAVAVKAVNNQRYAALQKYSLRKLFELAMAWNWNTEAEQVLWNVVNLYPEEKWAYPVLRYALIQWHRTRSFMQLMDTMSKRNPEDLAIKNDLAATALLLGAQEIKPNDLALEVYRKAPGNPYYASTYAYSLYLQHDNAGALKVMQQLSTKDLQLPSIAGYYGLILKANGNKTEAKAYFDRIATAQLLPEEQTLFQQAQVGL
jgi:predicted Zn-dependent protease